METSWALTNVQDSIVLRDPPPHTQTQTNTTHRLFQNFVIDHPLLSSVPKLRIEYNHISTKPAQSDKTNIHTHTHAHTHAPIPIFCSSYTNKCIHPHPYPCLHPHKQSPIDCTIECANTLTPRRSHLHLCSHLEPCPHLLRPHPHLNAHTQHWHLHSLAQIFPRSHLCFSACFGRCMHVPMCHMCASLGFRV